MKKIELPGTSLTLSRLSFGTASLHHLPNSSDRQSLLAAAKDNGFTHFDTAPLYGFGLAEQELGRVMSAHSGNITIASKVGLYPPGRMARNTLGVWSRKGLGKLFPKISKAVVDWSVTRAQESLERSLRLLKRDCLDILFLHEPLASMINEEEFLSWLLKQKGLGKIRYWGVAGELEPLNTWLDNDSGLCRIVQTRDSSTSVERLRHLKRTDSALITYGPIASAQKDSSNPGVSKSIQNALHRNPDGSVLVSSSSIAHLQDLVEASG